MAFQSFYPTPKRYRIVQPLKRHVFKTRQYSLWVVGDPNFINSSGVVVTPQVHEFIRVAHSPFKWVGIVVYLPTS